jgi:hypothetical protein
MPGTRCTVSFCKNSLAQTKQNPLTKNIKYHKFPKEPEIRNQWVKYCRRSGSWNPDSCHVCSEHFLPEDYERDLQAELLNLKPRYILKALSVPSVPPQFTVEEGKPVTKRKVKTRRNEQDQVEMPPVVVNETQKTLSPWSKLNKRESLSTRCSRWYKNEVPAETAFFDTSDCILPERSEKRELLELKAENARLTKECKELQATLQMEIHEKSVLMSKLKRAQEDIEFKNQILYSHKKRLMILKRKKLVP